MGTRAFSDNLKHLRSTCAPAHNYLSSKHIRRYRKVAVLNEQRRCVIEGKPASRGSVALKTVVRRKEGNGLLPASVPCSDLLVPIFGARLDGRRSAEFLRCSIFKSDVDPGYARRHGLRQKWATGRERSDQRRL